MKLKITNVVEIILVACLIISLGLAEKDRRTVKKFVESTEVVSNRIDKMAIEQAACMDSMQECGAELEACQSEIEALKHVVKRPTSKTTFREDDG